MFARVLKPAGRFVTGTTLVGTVAATLALLPATAAHAGNISSASPSVVGNGGTPTITFTTATSFNAAVPPKVQITGPGSPGTTYTASSVAVNGDGTIAATFPFATTTPPPGPGPYTAEICQDIGGTCSPTADDKSTSSILTITAAVPTVSSLNTPVRAQHADTTNTAFTIQGSNFAAGDTVAFVPQHAGDTAPGLQAPLTITATQISSHLTGLTGATPGIYDVVVTHTDGQSSSKGSLDQLTVVPDPTVDASSTPAVVGQGATAAPLTIIADNLPTADPLTLSFPSGGADGLSATLQSVTADTGSSSLTDVKLTVTTSSSTQPASGANAPTLIVTDGTTGGSLQVPITVTAAPTITSASPSAVGQGGSRSVTFSGANLGSGATLSFPASTKVSIVGSPTVDVANQKITATIAVDPAAPTGKVPFTITNTDGGSTTYTDASGANPSPFSVTAKPVLNSVSPASVPLGATNEIVTLNGTGFQPDLTATTDQPGVHFGAVNVPSGSSTNATMPVSVDSNAQTGPIKITLTNGQGTTGDGGTSSSVGLLRVDSFSISSIDPTTASNGSGSNAVAITISGSNIPTTGTTQLQLTRTGGDGFVVAPIVVNSTSVTSSVWKGTANLVGAAAGTYQVALFNGSNSGTCSCTFTITSAASPTITSVSPSALGQGATTTLVVNGTGFTQGATVTFSSGITSTGPTVFDSPSKLEVPIQVAPNASTSNKVDVTVTNPGPAPSGGSNAVTKTGAITVDAAPTITSFSPTALAQGAVTTLTINGTGFDANSATVSFGTGITQGSGATTITATQIKIPVKVDQASPSSVAVTVKNADFGTASKSITINAGPKITSVSPQYVANNFTGTLTITGSGYHSGATVSFPAGSNVATSGNATVSTDGTTISVPIKVTRTDAAQVDVTVTNNDDQGSVTLAKALSVATAPKDPTNVTAARNGTSITVSWTAVPTTDSGGAPITGYTVSVTEPAGSGLSDQKTAGTSVTFTGLSATADYTFKVVATNAANLSSPGATASTHAPLAGTQLTLAATAGRLVAGQHVSLGGSLSSGNGDPIGGATIVVSGRSDTGQTATVATTTTGSDGRWIVSLAPKHNTTYTASYAGNAQFAKGTSSSGRVTVAPKVTISAPSRSSSSNKLAVTGSVSPNKAGKTVTLTAVSSKGVKKTFRSTLSSRSSYKFKVKLGKGKWTLIVRIGSTSGNVAGHSSKKTIRRT